MLEPAIEVFGDGGTDRFSVMAQADEIASACNVRSARTSRGWAKEQIKVLLASSIEAGQPPPLRLPCATDPEPSTDPLSLDFLLNLMAGVVRRRVYCSPEAADACALWSAGSWGVYPPADPAAGADIFPRLHIYAPTKRCGKSTMLEVANHAVRRPLGATDVSEAALFRTIDQYRPTLLIDEADRLIAKNRDIVGLIDSGYARGNFVLRTEGGAGQGSAHL